MYGTCYEDVGIEEAIDLINTLPRGSAYVSATRPEHSWTDEKEAMADLIDALAFMLRGWDKYVRRPSDVAAQHRAVERARRARAVIERTNWEEVEGGEA